jgi:hypothetical protein
MLRQKLLPNFQMVLMASSFMSSKRVIATKLMALNYKMEGSGRKAVQHSGRVINAFALLIAKVHINASTRRVPSRYSLVL